MSMGKALRTLGGQGPMEVLTRLQDFNIQTFANPSDPSGPPAVVPGNTLVAFMAASFREVAEGADVWEFRTITKVEGGLPIHHNVYLRGEDVFMLRMPSQIAG